MTGLLASGRLPEGQLDTVCVTASQARAPLFTVDVKRQLTLDLSSTVSVCSAANRSAASMARDAGRMRSMRAADRATFTAGQVNP